MFRRLTALIGSLLTASATASDDRPNLVIIMSDDMGFSDIGCYGGEIETPTLDRLAAGGVRFSQFYNTGRCCPTRASLLTGLYPHQAGVGHMVSTGQDKDTDGNPIDGYTGNLNDRCVTIAEVLRDAGYHTAISGKWHVTSHQGPDSPKHNWPLQRGFDRFYGTIMGGGSFYDPTSLTRDNTMISPLADPEYTPETYYYTHAISDHAVRFIEEHDAANDDQPMFLYVSYTAAHWPMHALPEDIAKYEGRYDEGYDAISAARLQRCRDLGLVDSAWGATPMVGDWESVQHREWEIRCMEVYAAMVDSMDQGIHDIVRTLEATGELDNTLILFLQDNGGCAEGMGRGANVNDNWDKGDVPEFAAADLQFNVWPPMRTRDGRWTLGGPTVMPGPDGTYIGYGRNWANVSNTPFREYKHWVHEGGIATPLIVHWPDGIDGSREGSVSHQVGHLIDLMATAVDVGGATYPTEFNGHPIQPLEGVSLVPAFEGDAVRRTDAIYWEHESNRAIRVQDWKLVAKGINGPWELYDMGADRIESNDLAGVQPVLASALAAMWEDWAERARVVPYPNRGPWNRLSK